MSEQVPNGWFSTDFGELASKIEGGGTPSRNVSEYWNGTIPWATVKDLTNTHLSGTQETITEIGLKNSSSKLIPQNTVILATRMAVGKAVVFDKDVAINQDLKAVYPKANVDWKFLLQWYLAKSSYIEAMGTGSTVKGIRLENLRGIPVELPPLPEQQKIASILTSVDGVIEKTESQISKLQDLKKGVMQELLTKGISHTEFKDSPVGRIPVGWDVVKLDKVAEVQTGAAKSSKLTGELIELPYLRVANVQDGYLDLSEIKTIMILREKSERFLLKEDDVLVNEGGDFDKLGRGSIWHGQISPCAHQNHVFVVRTNKNKLLPMFFNHLSGSEHGKKYYMGCAKQTTNLASINSTQLKQFPVLLPTLAEQGYICGTLNSIDENMKKVQLKHSYYTCIKKALMQDLLTGKVRVKVN